MRRDPLLSKLTATIAFIVTALISSILLISSVVFLLGEILGSHLLSMVIVGGVCAITSWVIYSASLKPIITELEEQITTIYEVADAARRAYKWSVDYLISRLFSAK